MVKNTFAVTYKIHLVSAIFPTEQIRWRWQQNGKSERENTPAETAEPLSDQIDLKGKAIKLMNTTLCYF